MSKAKNYKRVPFIETFRGFFSLGHYGTKEYRAFSKQLKKKLDEYFIDDCYFSISTSVGPNALIKVTTNKNGNTYEIQPMGDWDMYTENNVHTTIAEWEYYALVDLVDMLDEDLTYVKDKVSSIVSAVKNNQPLSVVLDDDNDDTDNDASDEGRASFEQVLLSAFGHKHKKD